MQKKSLLLTSLLFVLLKMLFPAFSIFCLLAVCIFFQQSLLLFYQLGEQIPFRALFGSSMALHTLLGPALVYSGLEQYQFYKMAVSEDEYFSYAIPGVLAFLIGLNTWKKPGDEMLEIAKLLRYKHYNTNLPYILIIVGFAGSFILPLSPGDLAFVFYLFSMLKFIGLFLVIILDKKFVVGWSILVLGSALVTSVKTGMFHDLLTWLILTSTVLSIRFKASPISKMVALLSFVAVVAFIQTIKGAYRQKTWVEKEEAGFTTVHETGQQVILEKEGFFSVENLATHVTRFNQGWIVARIIDNVPEREPFAEGTTILQYAEAAALPRFLAPGKLKAGDREIFTKYTGIRVDEGTSMGLSALGDGYINFGKKGGWLFMFVYGLLFNFSLQVIARLSKTYPTLMLFAAIIFIYPIRPDCELQTILGHLLKASFFVFIIFKIFRHHFRYSS